MVETVGVMTRASACCNLREDNAHVLLTNVEAFPQSVVGAASWYKETDLMSPLSGRCLFASLMQS